MLGINLDRESTRPLQLQLTVALRRAVRSNALSPGEKLPPSRILAGELGVSRNLVTAAYDQLIAEGLLSGEVGRGTFIQGTHGGAGAQGTLARAPQGSRSAPGRPTGRVTYDFTPGRPDLAALPLRRWSECLRDGRTIDPEASRGYGSTVGELPLRREIAAWLFRIRGIEVHPERIVITSGTAQSLLLIALSERLPAPGAFYCEDASIPFARNAFRRAGYEVRPLPADQTGTPVPPQPDIRGALAYLNPSNRFPRGGRLLRDTRRAFLDWAERSDSVLLEDDYDAEFRYAGWPIEPMVVENPERVFYLGSFSKCLFPGLRIGYIIVPDPWRSVVLQTKDDLYMRTSGSTQRALARFMAAGHLDHHVRDMKRRYRERLDRIRQFLDSRYGEAWHGSGSEAGYHLSIAIDGHEFSRDFFSRCADEGLLVKGEGHYSFSETLDSPRLVIGFGNIRDERLDEGLEVLARIIGD